MNEKYFKAEMKVKEVIKKLEELSKEVSNIKPLLRVARRVLLNDIDENFETEGEASGDKWEGLDEEYAKKKEEAGAVDKILQFGGDLRTKKLVTKVTDRSLIIGNSAEYAAIHNFGKEEKMPQREFFRFSDSQIDELVAELEYWYLENVKYIGVK